MTAELRFIPNDADEDEGLSNPGIETFRDAPFAGIARECGQNSLDASVESPVTLRFDLLDIPRESFPQIHAYRSALEACRKRAEGRGKRDELTFFTNAVRVLSQPSIRVLRISDEGTTGLAGPCEQGTPFHALVKSAGVSQKALPTAGGSFGIGKHAAYAVSDLRTVFYSTIYRDSAGNERFLAQGKSILVSHTGADGKPRKASGYWGAPGYQPLSNPSDVPDWMRRTCRGTSIFAAGFPDAEHWSSRVAESLLRNFFVAVHRGTIRFCIDDESIVIDQVSLPSLFNDPIIRNAAEDNFTLDDFNNSYSLYQCLVDPATMKFETEISDLGKIRMHLSVRDHLPKRVFLIRNGMLITDNLQYFGDRLVRFPMYRDFISIVEPADSAASELMKRLEDPKHRDLSAERLMDRHEQKRVKKAMRALISWIRERIKSETFDEPEDEIEADEMSEFFADVSTDPPVGDPSSQDTDPERFTYTPMPLRAQGTARDAKGEHGGGGGLRKAKTKAKTKHGSGRGMGAGGTGTRGHGSRIEYYEFRNTPGREHPRRSRTLHFTPAESGKARLVVEAVGVQSNEVLRIAEVDGRGIHPASAHVITLTKDQRQHVSVTFDRDFEGPIELVLINEGRSDGEGR
jgi:hypothetical protein